MFRLEHYGITARLIFITVLPVALMFFSVVIYSYYSRYAEVQEEIAEHGHVLASSLAQSSEYGVFSGNMSYVEDTIRSLLQHDRNISHIEILNVDRRKILDIHGEDSTGYQLRTFEEPIRKEMVAINPFYEDGYPHVSSSTDTVSTPRFGETLGFVRVEMSSSRILGKQQHRIWVGSAIAGVALLISAILGLYLALGLTRPLARTIAVLRQIRKGDYAIQLDVTAGGEIGNLQLSIVEMAASLNQFKQDLEGKVAARTRDLEAARDEAIKSNAEKRKLIHKVNSAVEEERKTITLELHDQLNASLVVARLESQLILDLVNGAPPSKFLEDIKTKAESIIKLTSDVYALCRNIVRRLRPEVIDTLGLRVAIEEMVNRYDEIHPKCRFRFQAEGDFSSLPDEISITTYRVIQEALSNVVKHSGATEVNVCLDLKDSEILLIRVNDNGKGFDASAVDPGIGLIGMRERVHGLGGNLEVRSGLNSGTMITIELPVVSTR